MRLRNISCDLKISRLFLDSAYFQITRDISEAQFYLGNRFQELYLWQEVADRDMEVSRIENLLYGCFFHDDEEAMAEADREYVARN